MENFKTLEFINDNLVLIDQRKLPSVLTYKKCSTAEETANAISTMVVRGAPAIGATAGYGILLSAMQYYPDKELFSKAAKLIRKARPTAVNLSWAVDRQLKIAAKFWEIDKNTLLTELKKEADSIKQEDIDANIKMGNFGNTLIKQNATILTHCNAGALATSGWGTALGVIKTAFYDNKNIFVYADETRPRLQGARLTSWELMQEGIPSKLIPDSAAATLIRDGKIDCVIVGADRIASNGDTANKLGTFALSLACHYYNIPFYVAAPLSTFDFSMKTGKEIPIEERDKKEVTHPGGTQMAPEGMDVFNPAFDVTPNEFITAIITEKGIVRQPYKINLKAIKQ